MINLDKYTVDGQPMTDEQKAEADKLKAVFDKIFFDDGDEDDGI